MSGELYGKAVQTAFRETTGGLKKLAEYLDVPIPELAEYIAGRLEEAAKELQEPGKRKPDFRIVLREVLGTSNKRAQAIRKEVSSQLGLAGLQPKCAKQPKLRDRPWQKGNRLPYRPNQRIVNPEVKPEEPTA